MLTVDEKELISRSVTLVTGYLHLGFLRLKHRLFRNHGTTVVYSYDVTDGDMGLLRAGEAVKGDQLLFVPGCFHHLVLRSRKPTTETPIRWKLVGLIDMSAGVTKERRGYSKNEWAQLLKDGAVCNYSIE
jgi:hypothetical protein